MSVPAAFNRDENFVPVTNLGFVTTKEITYAAVSSGAVGETPLFQVTGVVNIAVMAVVGDVDLTGSGTLEVGDDTTTDAYLAQVAATALDAGEVWYDDQTPALIGSLPTSYVVSGGNVIQTIATDTVTAGTLTYYCFWTPISQGAKVVAV